MVTAERSGEAPVTHEFVNQTVFEWLRGSEFKEVLENDQGSILPFEEFKAK